MFSDGAETDVRRVRLWKMGLFARVKFLFGRVAVRGWKPMLIAV